MPEQHCKTFVVYTEERVYNSTLTDRVPSLPCRFKNLYGIVAAIYYVRVVSVRMADLLATGGSIFVIVQ